MKNWQVITVTFDNVDDEPVKYTFITDNANPNIKDFKRLFYETLLNIIDPEALQDEMVNILSFYPEDLEEQMQKHGFYMLKPDIEYYIPDTIYIDRDNSTVQGGDVFIDDQEDAVDISHEFTQFLQEYLFADK